MPELAETAAAATVISDDLSAFARELDAIRQRVVDDLGRADTHYIQSIMRLQRSAELGGRVLLFGSLVPPFWFAGVSLLALSKVLENMEIGHNVLHGQYDWTNDPALSASQYEWDWSCPAAHWRHSHNYVHHVFTNVVGQDRDLGYGLLRMTAEQPWHPGFLLQPLYALGLMLSFEAGIAVHDLEFNLVLRRSKSLRTLLLQSRPVLRKTSAQLLKDYVLFPLLAGPAAPLVLFGNLSANLARNVWAFAIIFCGHFPAGAEVYDAGQIERETRAQWYLRQIRGSANLEGPRWFHVLSGHLSHQIEHHLFPDIPAWRYPSIACEVRALCARHGVAYNSGTLGEQLRSAARKIAAYALPGTRGARALGIA